ncbi:ArnT family glycosyltransferase [Polluticoccus soli]|uniref:ArnT family glycosyltransferase n=1 Tax=Polluticoccus soli TaxID=3034150 RepID=UPI0023E23AE7|nr:hypothetical protein [Flavipsychrobacter sp. JY13-12]
MRTTHPAIPLFVFTLVFLVMCFVYYADLVFMYPFGFHEWAQADRLALALKFYDNGMNFFKPATFNLTSIKGVTGVEFPIQSWLAAALGHVFGRENISTCFRLLTLGISYAGLSALFLLCYRHTRDIIVSLLVPVFFMCSPIFIYYSCSYLPDTAAVSLCFVGFYFFDRYISDSRFRDLSKAIAFLTLAALIKTSTGTMLIGIMGITVLWAPLRTRIYAPGKVAGVFLYSVVALIAYYFYNQYLNKTYQSTLFLAKPYPFQEGEFDTYVNHAFKDFWIREYFVLPQYLLLVGIPAAGIPLLSKSREGRTVLATLGLFVLGVVAMALLFGHQFIQHDYYVVSIYFPLFGFMLINSVVAIRQQIEEKPARISIRSFAIGAMLILFVFADHHTYRRIHLSDDRYYSGWKDNFSTAWLKGTDKQLDELGVSRKEHVVVVGENAPNLSFVYLDRSGYLLEEHQVLQFASLMKEKNVRVAVGANKKMEDVYAQDSTLFNGFNVVKKEKMWVVMRK